MTGPVHEPPGSMRWNACEHPERPPDGWVNYSTSCRACMIALEALAHIAPTLIVEVRTGLDHAPADTPGEVVRVEDAWRDFLTRSRHEDDDAPARRPRGRTGDGA